MDVNVSVTEAARPAAAQTNPVLFVTQVPVPADFATIASVFGNAPDRMLSYLRGNGIPLTAYAPLAQGRAASDALSSARRAVLPAAVN